MRFKPDEKIFGKGAHFKPARLFKMARAKAYLFGGVEIRWHCAPEWLDPDAAIPAEAVFHFPGGLKDCLLQDIEGKDLVTDQIFAGKVEKAGRPRIARMGAWPGSLSTMASFTPIAIPFRPPTAAPMKRGFAPP